MSIKIFWFYITSSLSNCLSRRWLNEVPVPDAVYGSAPVGILTYSKSGYMSATITSTDIEDRPANLTFPFRDGQTDADVCIHLDYWTRASWSVRRLEHSSDLTKYIYIILKTSLLTLIKWALVGRHSIGYAGPLQISTAIPATRTHGQVIHGPLTVANVPSMAGASHIRNYTLFDNGKTLLIASQRDASNRGELWWKRLD